jgi:ribosomal protein S18 acetylase RimI-like enzyme
MATNNGLRGSCGSVCSGLAGHVAHREADETVSAVVVRRLAKAERHAWTDVRLRALAEPQDGASGGSWPWPEAWRERTRPLLPGTEQAFFVAEEEGTFVGCGGAYLADDGSATILSMWTAPAHRGRGIATRILNAIESWAERRGSHRLVLQVLPNNRGAQSLYARAGFRRIDGDPEVPMIEMERRLSGRPR